MAHETPEWRRAWVYYSQRWNEHREVLRRARTGGLLLVASPWVKPLMQSMAPDLWSIRTLALDPTAPPVATSDAPQPLQPLYVLFVREQAVIAPGDRRKKWTEDKQAREIFESLRDKGLGETIIPCYAVSDAPAHTIADLASTIGAERVLLGAPQRSTLIHMLRGNIIREVAALLPDDITLLVCV